MVNIVITTRCNQNCPFCFFQNKNEKSDISLENFKKISTWLNENKIKHIGILGGEPLLHNKLYDLLEILNKNKIKMNLITNATVNFEKKIILHPSIETFLINASASKDDKNREKLENNINKICTIDKYKKSKICLGITIYKKDQDIDYIFELCKKYSINSIRLDISQPSLKCENLYIKPKDYKKISPLIIKVLSRCKDLNIKPKLDCGINVSISNILSNRDLEWVKILCKPKFRFCRPIIDIFPDLSVIFCFPLMNFKIDNILNYNIKEIKNIFLKKIEKYVNYNIDYQGTCIRNLIENKCKQSLISTDCIMKQNTH